MTKQELDEIRERWESAALFMGFEGIACMLADVPKLLDEVERLQRRLHWIGKGRGEVSL